MDPRPESRGTLEWEVVLPERTAAPLGARKPLANVVISSGSPEGDILRVPVAVAKLLSKRRDAGDIHPGSRNELIYELGRAEEGCAAQRLVALVDKRDYSRKEAGDKLRHDGYGRVAVETVLERAVEAGLIDDGRFAAAFVRSKVGCGWGLRRIERALAERGIDASDVEGWPDEFLDGQSEYDRAFEVVSRRRIPDKNSFPKIVRFLVGRGFSVGVASEVARALITDVQEQDCS